MMLLDNQYNIGDTVYLKTDIEQCERIITGFNVRQTGITYGLSFGIEESWHYDFEMTVDKDVLKTTNN